jgi:hypothetical protein
MELMFAEWEDGERFSFEDSDRFEEDSLCSFISEAESLCQNWRGWRKQSAGPNSPTGGGGGGGSGGTRTRGEGSGGPARAWLGSCLGLGAVPALKGSGLAFLAFPRLGRRLHSSFCVCCFVCILCALWQGNSALYTKILLSFLCLRDGVREKNSFSDS